MKRTGSALTKAEQKIAKNLRKADEVLAGVLKVLSPAQVAIVKATRGRTHVWAALDEATFFMELLRKEIMVAVREQRF